MSGGVIEWVGSTGDAPAADRRIDLQGGLVTPGFVDAHVHATSTGLALTGVDLTGTASAQDMLTRLGQAVRDDPDGIIIGHGWDETTWPAPTLPTRADIDSVVGDRLVYASRIDVHSALVSTALVKRARLHSSIEGYSSSGALSRAAHHGVREVALNSIAGNQRHRAQAAFLAACASRGIVAVHEMAGPGISSADDLADLLDTARQGTTVLVTGYWGELAEAGGVDMARELRAHGVAGDLFIDGSLGSHTACLHGAYSDDASTTGAAYLSREQVKDHVVAATRAGLQAGFHVIGDAACSTVIGGYEDAAHDIGTAAIRAARHRLEHAEMLADRDIEVMRDLDIAASMQPLFDALWGEDGGMYQQRVGQARARRMNRFRDIHRSEVRLVFGSDAPVTPLGPWAAVRAAVQHHQADQRIDLATALDAHTRQGWHAVGRDDAGLIAGGQRAHLAIWEATDLESALVNDTIRARATVVDGRAIHDPGLMWT
jgi:predicted amidohydrolase YtcJ